ncbi:MAG TPA: hypothetical protein P5543_11875 [Planctomycetota bacterium]|nr:hypothetical protein [Planctomycetota bacterium]HRU52875.1 hypothetical protein [Planctomycetota bacterium]
MRRNALDYDKMRKRVEIRRLILLWGGVSCSGENYSRAESVLE